MPEHGIWSWAYVLSLFLAACNHSKEADWEANGAAVLEAAIAPRTTSQALRPDGDVQVGWRVVGGGDAYSKLHERVKQPASVDDAGRDHLFAGGAARVTEVTMENPTLTGDIVRAVAWFYANTGSNTRLRAEILWNGRARASVNVLPSSDYQWHAITVDVRSRDEVNDLRLRFTSEGGGDTNLRAAYVEVEVRQVVRPDSEVRREWLTVDVDRSWMKLRESVEQPAVAASGREHLRAGEAGRVLELALTNPSGAEGAMRGNAWFYASTGSSTSLRVEVVSNGLLRGAMTLAGASAFRWRNVAFSISTREEADDVRLRFISEGGGDANFRAAYVELEPRALSLAVLGSAVKIRPKGFVQGGAAAFLVAARNEFEASQVAVYAPVGKPLRELRVSLVGPLTGPKGALIPHENVTVYRVGYVPVTVPSDPEGAAGLWPDPLIPSVDPIVGETRNAFPVTVPSGENRVAWLDVRVPRDAAPGTYEGTVELRAEGYAARVPLQIKVLNFTLPSTTTLKSSFGLSGRDECTALRIPKCASDSWARAYARQLFVRSALDNRITISHAHASNLTASDGNGLAQFRTYTLPFIRGTAATRLHGARLTNYQVNLHGDLDRPGWQSELAAWRSEARVQGFDHLTFVFGCDEPHFFPEYGASAENWDICRAKLKAVLNEWPQAPKLVTTHRQSSSEYGANSLVDIMVLNVELLDGPEKTDWYPGNQRPKYDAFLADPSRPKQLWLYTACGSHGCTRNDDSNTRGWAGYEIDAPASETRAMPWLAFRYDASGTLYYSMSLQLRNAWEGQYLFTGNGEGNLFYPGTPDRIGGTTAIPIESLRMKLVRDGYEDYEYLRYLRDHGRESEAHEIARALFPAPYDTARNDSQVQAARKALASLIADIVGGPAP